MYQRGAKVCPAEREARRLAGIELKRVRTERGMSQRAFAKLIGMPGASGMVSGFERGLLNTFGHRIISRVERLLSDSGFSRACQRINETSEYRKKVSVWADPFEYKSSYREMVIGHRLLQGVSSRQLAARIGVSKAAIRALEYRGPHAKVMTGRAVGKGLRAVARELGVHAELDERCRKRNAQYLRQTLGRTRSEVSAQMLGRWFSVCRVRMCLSQFESSDLAGEELDMVDRIENFRGHPLDAFSVGNVLEVLIGRESEDFDLRSAVAAIVLSTRRVQSDQMTAGHISELIHVSYEWVSRLRKRGLGPPFTDIGRQRIYDPSDVMRWLESMRGCAPSDVLHDVSFASDESFLTTPMASALAGVTIGYLNRCRIGGGGPPFVKLGSRRVYALSELVRWSDTPQES